MQTLIQILGYILIALALIHAIFPRYFCWEAELAGLSQVNREMMKVHTFFIAVTVGLMGLLCITSADLLLNTILGKRILWGLTAFWFLRLLVQFFGYSRDLWRGKLFETTVHILFSLLWISLVTVFGLGAMRSF